MYNDHYFSKCFYQGPCESQVHNLRIKRLYTNDCADHGITNNTRYDCNTVTVVVGVAVLIVLMKTLWLLVTYFVIDIHTSDM